MLKPDKLGDKLLVHNYGHGGAGMSLAWGMGLMAAEFATVVSIARSRGDRLRIGLLAATCARQLQRRGFDVTIYALAVPPNVDVEHVARRFHARGPVLVVADQRTAGVGGAVPPRGRHLVPPAAASGRAALRGLVAGTTTR